MGNSLTLVPRMFDPMSRQPVNRRSLVARQQRRLLGWYPLWDRHRDLAMLSLVRTGRRLLDAEAVVAQPRTLTTRPSLARCADLWRSTRLSLVYWCGSP
jgi:hypothetical protein